LPFDLLEVGERHDRASGARAVKQLIVRRDWQVGHPVERGDEVGYAS